MKKNILLFCLSIATLSVWAAKIDMQAHIGTDEATEAYQDYINKQKTYYQNTDWTAEGDQLFGELNTLMGSTCQLVNWGKSYNSLRYAYVRVDRDLNTSGKIIGYYDGQSMNGEWDSGNTYNREHTWPQSKGADKGIPMGYDMQSVRPTASEINGERGSTPYGEKGSYYDPDDIKINNNDYRKDNLGSYRGDAARVILYDYLFYGQRGSYKNSFYNGKAQLLSKLGGGGVFESLKVIIKWHMQDPPSLTEMVRNDGGQNYQGNRNPFIDFPDIALRILKDDITSKGDKVYSVSTTSLTAIPAYTYTMSEGFICYLSNSNGFRPQANDLTITGAQYDYNEDLGRLTIYNVTGSVAITSETTNLHELHNQPTARKRICNGQIVIEKAGKLYNIMGQSL